MDAVKELARTARRSWIAPTVTKIGVIARVADARADRIGAETAADRAFAVRTRVVHFPARQIVTHQ